MAEEYNRRSVKTLRAAKAASAHQKEWFLSLRERVANGEPLLFGMPPLEVVHAMDIPCIVTVWWTALCSAKQYGKQMYGFLDDAGYRSDVCSYCISGLACGLDPHPEEGPWGGLPKPTAVITGTGCENSAKIGELMAKAFGTKVYYQTNTVATEVDPDLPWYDMATDHWDQIIQSKCLDRAEEELWNIIRFLEQETGRNLDMNRLIQAINWGVEQNLWFRKARDLIARTVPAPVAIADVVGAVMQTQWHKGTEWAVGHAKAFYEEVKERVDNGVTAIKNERIRLMWLGRGLWFNLAFYQYFEEKYGAAFIWSMYLAMAADTHPKRIIGDNPVRALAAYETMNVLHVPPWNNNWFLSEAIRNQIDGVVYLVPENCMNNGDFAYFIAKRLEDAGFPVCVLRADPADDKKWDQDAMTAAVEDLIVNRIIPNQEKKKAERAAQAETL